MKPSPSKSADVGESVRMDKWLWAARLYKTRTLATQACKAGHVKIQGTAVKPSRMLRVGETLQARCGFLLREVRVRALLERRVSAKELPAYLEEISVPEDLRPAARQQMTPPVSLRPRGSGRPTKRDRRRLDALDWG